MKKIIVMIFAVLMMGVVAKASEPAPIPDPLRVNVVVKGVEGNWRCFLPYMAEDEFSPAFVREVLRQAFPAYHIIVVAEENSKANMDRQDQSYTDRYNSKGRVKKGRMLATSFNVYVTVSVNAVDRDGQGITSRMDDLDFAKRQGIRVRASFKATIEDVETSTIIGSSFGNAEAGMPDDWGIVIRGKEKNQNRGWWQIFEDDRDQITIGHAASPSEKGDFIRKIMGQAMQTFVTDTASQLGTIKADLIANSDYTSVEGIVVNLDNARREIQINLGELDGVYKGTEVVIIQKNGTIAGIAKVTVAADHRSVAYVEDFIAAVAPGMTVEIK